MPEENNEKNVVEEVLKEGLQKVEEGHDILDVIHSAIRGLVDVISQLNPTKLFSVTEEVAINQIAQVCHEVNREYCKALGDDSQPHWGDAPEWQKESAIKGVELHSRANRGPEESHESWMAEKKATGWTYGPVKDEDKKEHPCMVPFADLPPEQKAKDYIFRSVVHALR